MNTLDIKNKNVNMLIMTTDIKPQYECKQCGHQWEPKKRVGATTPKSCPRCKRYDWQDEPKKEK